MDDLKIQIEQDVADGKSPFFINATAGTTVLGAIDDIPEISLICKKYKIWLHVDVSSSTSNFEFVTNFFLNFRQLWEGT